MNSLKMNNLNGTSRLLGRVASGIFAVAMVAFGAWAQDTTTTTVKHGPSSYDTQVKNAEVVYVEGNDLVLRVDGGKIEHLVVPDSDKFTIDGKEVSANELTPGTKITQTITTTTAPRYVTTVRTIKGKVWHVTPHRSTVILTLPDHTNQSYTIPNHAKITVDGRDRTVFDLRKGMNLVATTITDDTQTVIDRNKSIVGTAPAPPATPRLVGSLLIFHPIPVSAEPVSMDDPQLASTLPATGSVLPLAGLLGALGISMSLGLGAVRRALKA